MIGTRLGPYEIVSALGAGGMGEVWRARDSRLGRDVAIKVLPAEFAADPARLRRFEQEARAIAALDHPNILAIHDVGTHEGVPYLVEELLEGESLRERLVGGALPFRRAVETSVQIAQGLAAAHEKGIVHRDLKPENVFVTSDGRVKILDFGVAKLAPPRSAEELAKATTVTGATEAGTLLGTVGYMSPEQLRGQSVDHRSDIFSFGCVLHEMLSGRRVFVRNTGPDTISAVLHEEPAALPPGVPGSLERIVKRCLEKRPDGRFSSAHDLALALQAFEVGGSREVRRLLRPQMLGRQRWAAAGLGILLVAAAGWWLATRHRTTALPEFQPRRVATRLANVLDAALSPDGDEIAYSVEEAGFSDIWVVDVRGGRPIRLTDGSSRFSGPTWFPDGGSIAFSSGQGVETSVWKIPRFGGTAMLLVPNAQDAAISPTGVRIAFVRPDEDGNLRIWDAAIDDVASARRLTAGGVGVWDHRQPAWSPDGRSLCFQDKRNLWLVPAEGGDARPLTVGDAVNSNPVWSADGEHIYFSSLRDGVWSLWRMPVGGGRAVRVTHGAGSEESPSVSRAGRHLAFVSGLETTGLVLVDLETGRFDRIQSGRTTEHPTIAPNRGAVVFASDLGGISDLWLQPLRGNTPAGDAVRLTDHPGTCALPKYSPDGRWVAYFRVVEGQRDVWVVPASGGTPVNFTGRGGINVAPSWSPDGRQIAFVSVRDGREQVWVAPFAAGRRTGEMRRVTDEKGITGPPCWSPDGREIAYVLFAGAGSDVRVADVDGNRPPRSVTDGAQALTVRWWWERNRLLVAGYWGGRVPSIRLVPPPGGEGAVLDIPGEVALDAVGADFDLSRDGSLLVLCQRSKQAELWVLEADKRAF